MRSFIGSFAEAFNYGEETKIEAFAIYCADKKLFLVGTKRDNLSDKSACVWLSEQDAQEALGGLVTSNLRLLGMRTYGQKKYNLAVVRVSCVVEFETDDVCIAKDLKLS